MLGIVTILWLILFLITPVLLFISSNNSQNNETSNIKILGKIFLSIVAHLAISIFTWLFLMVVIVGPEPRPIEKMGVADKVICLIIDLFYAFSVWLLCSFVNGGFIKSFDIFGFKKEKTLSVFNEN